MEVTAAQPVPGNGQACPARGIRRHQRRRSLRVRVDTGDVQESPASGSADMACGGRVGG